jgi:transcription elongation factor GreA
MINNEIILTNEGFLKLKEELKEREKGIRKEIADRLRSAKELGDLSENDEYKTSKEAHSFNEGRISEIKNMILRAKIIKNNNSSIIEIGSKFRVKSGSSEYDYNIVGSNEADPSSFKFSNESPIGKVFLGKEKGDVVNFKTPSGSIIMFEIVKIL